VETGGRSVSPLTPFAPRRPARYHVEVSPSAPSLTAPAAPPDAWTRKLLDWAARDKLSLRPVQAPALPVVQALPLRFTGSAGEYFRVWMVNVALSIVTLGLYGPWARVRTRQYFYAHTLLDGHNFGYTARPRALLGGYLIIGALFAVYTLTQNFDGASWISYALLGAAALLYPLVLFRSLRFQAHHSLHRGLRFSFLGGAGGAYVFYGLLELTLPFTFGLTLPLLSALQRRYLASGLSYGTARGAFRGGIGGVYLIYLLAALGLLAAAALLGTGAVILAALKVFDGLDAKRQLSQLLGALLPLLGLLGLGLLGYTAAGQGIRAALLRYTLNNVQFGPALRLRATFSPWMIVWFALSSGLVQILSFGLATPWAAVRRNRYLLGRTEVLTLAPLDGFSILPRRDENALGEAAAELLGFRL
jgi:uncharacterized membrane protein YjgN (DUF898 family)